MKFVKNTSAKSENSLSVVFLLILALKDFFGSSPRLPNILIHCLAPILENCIFCNSTFEAFEGHKHLSTGIQRVLT